MLNKTIWTDFKFFCAIISWFVINFVEYLTYRYEKKHHNIVNYAAHHSSSKRSNRYPRQVEQPGENDRRHPWCGYAQRNY